MALTSASMPSEMLTLLKKVKNCEISLVFGFIRQLKIESSIPDSIINFCVIYAFLKVVNEWYKGIKDHCTISESKLKVTLIPSKRFVKGWTTIFANPVITRGKHEWKFNCKTWTSEDMLYFGIASNMDCLESDNNIYTSLAGKRSPIAKNGGYSYCVSHKSTRFDHTWTTARPYKQKDGEDFQFTAADTFSVHLDLDNKTFGVSKNNEEIVIVYENIKQASYRFGITVWRQAPHIFEFCE